MTGDGAASVADETEGLQSWRVSSHRPAPSRFQPRFSKQAPKTKRKRTRGVCSFRLEVYSSPPHLLIHSNPGFQDRCLTLRS